MTKKKLRYESRVFDGRIIHSAEIEHFHREVLDFERIEAISERHYDEAQANRGRPGFMPGGLLFSVPT